MEFKESDRLLLRWSAHPSFLPECILYLFDRSSCNVLNIDIAEVFFMLQHHRGKDTQHFNIYYLTKDILVCFTKIFISPLL